MNAKTAFEVAVAEISMKKHDYGDIFLNRNIGNFADKPEISHNNDITIGLQELLSQTCLSLDKRVTQLERIFEKVLAKLEEVCRIGFADN